MFYNQTVFKDTVYVAELALAIEIKAKMFI